MMKDGLMKMKTDGQMRSKKMADEVLETKEYSKPEVDAKIDEAVKATEARETAMADKPVEQERKEAEAKDAKKVEDEKKEEDSILINPRKTGKLKIELRPDSSAYMTGKNIKDNDKLPLFLITYGINIMLQKDVKPSYIMNGILAYKPFKEKMIVENYEKDHENKGSESGADTVSTNMPQGINPLAAILGSMMASGVSASEVQEVKAEPVQETESNE